MNFINNNKNIQNLLLVFLLLYPWYFVISGIDMTDAGYWLTYYKNFFDNPESVIRGFPVWLTLVIGASANKLLGDLGLFSFNIMNVLIIYLSLYLSYKILNSFTNKTTMLFTLAISVVFINIDRSSIVSYDNLTVLFYLIAAYFIYYGLVEGKKNYLFLSGIVLGLNIFIRFPNLLGIGLIIVIFYYNYISNTKVKKSLKEISYVLAGYSFSIIAVVLVLKSIGHFELYVEGLNAMLATGKGPSDSPSLIKTFLNDQLFAFKYGVAFIIGLIVFSWLSKFWNKSTVISFIMLFVLSGLSTLYVMKISYILQYPNYYFLHMGVIGIFYISLILIILKTLKIDPKFSTIALITFLIIELIPLGSNTHLRKSVGGLYLGLPIILIYLYSLSTIKLGPFLLESKQVLFLKKYVSLTLILFSVIVSTFYFAAYCDNGNKFKMTSTSDIPLLKYNLTTEERADTLIDVLENLKQYEDKYEYMFTYGRIPLIQYLSNTKPFIDNPNPLFETPNAIKIKLDIAAKNKSLPLVIQSKTVTSAKTWPAKRYKVNKSTKMTLMIQDFLKKYNYTSVWQNDDFEILVPQK